MVGVLCCYLPLVSSMVSIKAQVCRNSVFMHLVIKYLWSNWKWNIDRFYSNLKQQNFCKIIEELKFMLLLLILYKTMLKIILFALGYF